VKEGFYRQGARAENKNGGFREEISKLGWEFLIASYHSFPPVGPTTVKPELFPLQFL
jgi:hypothetical protein